MLKSLELFGFKSFADRTTFDFDPGVTGVVGPNGSGKSNVVDALKWILGVQSAKSLRGKSMADVIFNGASGRKPANAAEATIVFDNRKRTLDLDFDEVRVGRRLLRSGESEYLVNDSAVRLKDVVQLFMGTGAGSNAYSIIEQGRVDQILNANAAARRKVFDEAAGIARYKSDRTEAERKLERVEQNLVRLTDIVDEVESRLDSVRSQAAKAAKFRELRAELKELWWGLAADECRAITSETERIETTLAEDAARVAEVERQRGELQGQQDRVEAELARIEESRRSTEQVLARQREAAASRETTIQHERERLVDLESDVTRLRRQRALLNSRLRESELEFERADAQLDHLRSSAERARSELDRIDAQIDETADERDRRRSEIEEHREQLLAEVQRRTEIEHELRSAETRLQGLVLERDEAERRCESLREVLAEKSGEIAARERRLQTTEEAVRQAEQVRDAVREQRRALVDTLDEFQRTIADRREQRSAAEARRRVLEDLESRQEGFGIGVREILDRASTIDAKPWNRIRGAAADLLQVDLEHAAVVDVALGSRAQLIVVDDVRLLAEYLQRGETPISGRVGFVGYAAPLVTHEDLDLRGEPGVTCRADELAASPDTLPELARRLLGDTWVVDTLADALRLHASSGASARFVTPQGDLVEADGTLQVGSVRHETAIVSRKSELRRLRVELARLDRRIESEQDRASIVGEDLVGIETELDESDAALAAAVATRNEATGELQSARRELAKAKKESTAASDALAELERRMEELRVQIESSAERRQSCTAHVESLQDTISAAEQSAARLEESGRQLEREREEQRLVAAKQDERFEALERSSERLRDELDLRREQRDESERRNTTVATKARSSILQQLNTRSELDELHLADGELAQKASVLTRKRDGLREARAELAARGSRHRDEQRALESRRHEQEIALRDTNHRRTSLAERIEEEYQVSLDEILASGASALAARAEELGEAGADLVFDDIRDDLNTRVERLRRKLKSFGSVATESLHDLDALETRFGRLSSQLEDLQHARDELRDVVRRINGECRRLFHDSFDTIRGHFRELFRKLFGGGDGDIVLEDPDDALECGVEVVARPPGKELRNLSLLSGGERTMTAVALLMAIFKSRPSPFCILDEVDAALDEANVDRFNTVVREFADTTQFIIITHRKPTMTVCDVLYGVTMQESGVSKPMTVRFDEVTETGEIRSSRTAA